MVRTRELVKISELIKGQEVWTEEKMTCIDGLGVRQVYGNRVFTVTITKGERVGRVVASANTFYEAADFARTLMQNHPNLYELIAEKKFGEVIDAARTTQFMLAVHFGTTVSLPFGDFNS